MNEMTLFNSLLDDLFGTGTAESTYSCVNAPRVDVKEAEDAYTLEMELPGRSEKDINIELDKNKLTIESKLDEKKEDSKKEKYLLRERRSTNFKRGFTLPEDVDKESIKANFKNGILCINMQKKAVTPAKTISIEAC